MTSQAPPVAARPSLAFDNESRDWLESFMPVASEERARRPFITLTYAQSLDSSLASAPGVRTTLSGPETKAMTHYLRSRHDAIFVGIGTALADNPALNCRLNDAVGDLSKQPRPIVLDPKGRWDALSSECLRLAREGLGKAPWVLIAEDTERQTKDVDELTALGGQYLRIAASDAGSTRLSWQDILLALYEEGMKSVMIEGGGSIINSLLGSGDTQLIDSVIVTIAPTWLGAGGVLINPARTAQEYGSVAPAVRLRDTRWRQFGEDVVLCGYPKTS